MILILGPENVSVEARNNFSALVLGDIDLRTVPAIDEVHADKFMALKMMFEIILWMSNQRFKVLWVAEGHPQKVSEGNIYLCKSSLGPFLMGRVGRFREADGRLWKGLIDSPDEDMKTVPPDDEETELEVGEALAYEAGIVMCPVCEEAQELTGGQIKEHKNSKGERCMGTSTWALINTTSVMCNHCAKNVVVIAGKLAEHTGNFGTVCPYSGFWAKSPEREGQS